MIGKKIMARPKRCDCDYFPFYAKDGRTLFILENKYACKGTGFFTNVLRFLTLQENHYFCIKEDSDRLYFFSKTKCDEESGMDMLNIMAKTCKIHSHLWITYKVIASQALLNSLEDAYRNRKNSIITLDEILVSYEDNPQATGVSYVRNPQEGVVSDVEKPQTKLKETKLKKTKENKKKIKLPDWLPIDLWKEFKELRIKLKKPLTTKAEQLNINTLDKLRKNGNNPKAVIEKTIERGWQGFFSLKDQEGTADDKYNF